MTAPIETKVWRLVLVVGGIKKRARNYNRHVSKLCEIPDTNQSKDELAADFKTRDAEIRTTLDKWFRSYTSVKVTYMPEVHKKYEDYSMTKKMLFDPREVEFALEVKS